ncbi:hypothetical protein [Gordonia neofelifaecis]|uniref:Serine/threonine protein kinase n=1 Tax=Gordonia neofelifaecis NRRL B-59395 TaxID=644548 RepID=F1YFZ3_9ACTN|nr:hypothetical protein [Gordonia neofelifaecis]EGD56570.1 hypothetical protein SCNU_03427 [Gordonia neofelifaecis NRRL B-59395]
MSYQQYPDPGYQPSGPQPPKRPSPWSSPAVLIALIAGVIVLIAGVTVAIVYSQNRKNDTASTTAAPSPPPATVTQTQTGAPPATVTVQPTTAAPTTTTGSGSGPVTVPGADRQGFLNGPRCNAAEDDAVFVGYTDRSQVVICQVGSQTGRYYYKGEADGNTVEVGYPTRSGDTFVATNADVDYVVTPSSLTIRQGGATVTVEPMIASWVG